MIWMIHAIVPPSSLEEFYSMSAQQQTLIIKVSNLSLLFPPPPSDSPAPPCSQATCVNLKLFYHNQSLVLDPLEGNRWLKQCDPRQEWVHQLSQLNYSITVTNLEVQPVLTHVKFVTDTSSNTVLTPVFLMYYTDITEQCHICHVHAFLFMFFTRLNYVFLQNYAWIFIFNYSTSEFLWVDSSQSFSTDLI